MWGRVLRVTTLGAIIAVVLAQPAAAFCPVTPVRQLVKTSDDVWWGTVIKATAAGPRFPEMWRLGVRLDDVLKGDGMPNDHAVVYAGSCGKAITRSEVTQFAHSFVGEQRMFFISLDDHHRQVAYSEIVGFPGDTPSSPSTPADEYDAALHALGLQPPPPGIPTEGGSEANGGAAMFGLVAAGLFILVGVAIVALFFRRQTR